jgi:hypothetical protein
MTSKVHLTGYVYCVMNNVDEKLYVGSTVTTLRLRMQAHQCSARRNMLTALHVHIRAIGVKHFFIVPLQCFNNITIPALRRCEGYAIQIMNADLNKNIAGRTPDEYTIDNVAKRQEFKKLHAVRLKNRKLELRSTDDQLMKSAARSKQFYIDNREKILLRQRIVMQCVCGYTHTKVNKSTHMKSSRHLAALAAQ